MHFFTAVLKGAYFTFECLEQRNQFLAFSSLQICKALFQRLQMKISSGYTDVLHRYLVGLPLTSCVCQQCRCVHLSWSPNSSFRQVEEEAPGRQLLYLPELEL